MARTKPRRDAAVDMESPNERGDIDPIIDKIRRGEISVIEAVAEELPDVFRTHVVPKLTDTCLKDTLNLARVNKSFYEAVWSAEGFGSIQKKCSIWQFTGDEQHAWFAGVHTCWRGPRANDANTENSKTN